ncbi:hypothetical protein [Klenkia sp. PcliD-1-E]|uniref:hypothetical protein n=1 Tax=Klenkia sp. PcliD-1-E TaxID=2954492 RepID=UPI002097BB01|nr:hypothetical protein [Klenkia sp. PcliD-1-E]MCO7222276.1 hypothetical protein [Klenkia sp. PcliD-1-E]
MEPTDPRSTGTRRVRLATAAVAGGALVGTGALAVVVAQAHPAAAAAEDTAPSGTESGSTAVPGDDDRPTAPVGPTGPTGGVSGGHGGRAHTSSGSS